MIWFDLLTALCFRLFYFMLINYRNCGQYLPADGMSLDYTIYTLCALIQHERNLIIEMDIPNALRDLLLEQCKMLAYTYTESPLKLRTFFVFFFRFSITLWYEWLFNIHRWVYFEENQRMANRHRVFWILWWCFISRYTIGTEIKTACKPFERQLFGSYDWFGCSNIWSLDQNYHRFLCKSTLKERINLFLVTFFVVVVTHRTKVCVSGEDRGKRKLSIYILKLYSTH